MKLKYALPPLFAATILLIDGAYIWNAWRTSPTDRWNWAFVLWSICIAALMTPALRRTPNRHDLSALLPFLLCATGWVWAWKEALHVGVYAAATGMIWTLVWLLQSWRAAMLMLPSAIILLLGGVSMDYATGALRNRCLICGAATLIAAANFRRDWIVPSRRGTLFFLAAVIFVLAGAHFSSFVKSYPPLLLDLQRVPDGFQRLRIEPSREDRQFFKSSRIARRILQNQRGSVGILEVWPGTAVHELHPVGHCLRSAGAVIYFDRDRDITLDGQVYPVNEVICARNGKRYLYWSWCGDAANSFSGPTGFRLHRTVPKERFSIQMNTRIRGNDLAAARSRLRDILSALKQ